ncbi:hypothetical protein ACOYW6_09670 [Parablastomonas sp. CN1-191]|uniref:hypothetical protein n=1 Tax=Parablastomonas sp. CN1-191 TaxID=3400908 RepID=UPI003BF78491
MNEDHIYIPAIGSERGLGEIFPIDAHAPRGVFETDDGNIYLVCDAPGTRFAVVLKHQFYRAFQSRSLGAVALDHGRWLGVGRFCVVSDADEDAGDADGQLLILEDILQMWVQLENGKCGKPVVAHGAWYADFIRRIDVWALVADNRIVFQHDGTGSLFPEQLADMVKELL